LSLISIIKTYKSLGGKNQQGFHAILVGITLIQENGFAWVKGNGERGKD
jgi:hypothetical protein